MATARCPCSLASGGTADQTAPSARCPPGHPQTRRGTARWACRGGHAPPGRGEGDTDGKEPPSTPQAQGASGAPPAPHRGPWFPYLGPGCGPEQDPVVGGARGAQAWAGGLAGGPGSPRDGKQIPGGGCRGTPGSGNSHGARNEEGAWRMRGPTAQTVLASWPGFNPSPSLPGLRAHPPRGPAHTAGQPQAPPPGLTFQKHFLGQPPCLPHAQHAVARRPQRDPLGT